MSSALVGTRKARVVNLKNVSSPGDQRVKVPAMIVSWK
jgi:hypothetical protein